MRARPAIVVTALTAFHVALAWCLPIVPGHDMPQHLAYARILASYDELPIRDTFTLPSHEQPYFVTHRLVALIARYSSVELGARIVFTIYAIGLVVAFARLVAAGGGPSPKPAWTALFGPLFIWNPVQCMGFLPFMLAVPVVLWGAASLLTATWDSEGRARAAAQALACGVILASLHVVAAGLLVGFAVAHAIANPARRAFEAAAGVTSVVALTAAGWAWLDVGAGAAATFPEHATWDPAAARAKILAATVLGPFPALVKVIIALAILSLLITVLTARPRGPRVAALASPCARRALRRTAIVFFAVNLVVPSSLQGPDDLSLIDFRMFVPSALFALASVDPRPFEWRRARTGLTAFAAFVSLVWARQIAGVAGEAESVLRLVARLDQRAVVLALPFHDRSDYLDESNGLSHYLPLYHTVRNGGITSLFWGRFTRHLPVGYRPGKEPPHPPDWQPWKFTLPQLRAATHVLVELPDEGSPADARDGAQRLLDAEGTDLERIACEARWCLLRRVEPIASRRR